MRSPGRGVGITKEVHSAVRPLPGELLHHLCKALLLVGDLLDQGLELLNQIFQGGGDCIPAFHVPWVTSAPVRRDRALA